MINMGGDHRSVGTHFEVPGVKKATPKMKTKMEKTRKSTRFTDHAASTQDSVESNTWLEKHTGSRERIQGV